MTYIETSPVFASASQSRVTEFKLANGMHIVVIPDRRAPVVTHMIWYRVGAADEPRGVSGIAHFLEHLMFKGTKQVASGDFSRIVARLGGNDNAFTGHDATAYFQRVAKQHLRQVMSMEADRMVNLTLDEREVMTERDVVLEERRSRVENSPSSILSEQMSAALYQNHPYGIPVIGWMHEIEQYTKEKALDFYKRHYGPNNAILVVAGDAEPDEVRKLAEETYGKIPANPQITERVRVKEPPHRAPRRIEYRDPRAGRITVSRHYLVPSYNTAAPGEAEALDLMMKVAAGGSTSRLYRSLVVDKKIASSASGYYSGSNMDSGIIGFSAVVGTGSTVAEVEAAIDAVIEEMKTTPVSVEELDRAKRLYAAEYIYQTDSQSSLARRYGWGLVTGATVAQIDAWPMELAKVTVEQVQAAAVNHLLLNNSVTGVLLPEAKAPDAPAAPPAAASAPPSAAAPSKDDRQ